MSIARYLKAQKENIDKALHDLLPDSGSEPRDLHKAMRYSLFSGGKRLRPILVTEACIACGKRGSAAGIPACAVELVHTYSLIHDDLPAMDDDDLRRGKPTCHKKFGEANAILAGDALLTLALGILGKVYSGLNNSHIGTRIVTELCDAIGSEGMVGGQAMDLEIKGGKRVAGGLSLINMLKTARLFEASTKIGAIAAGASERDVKSMARYGINFGLAFQIVDDIIDGESYRNPSSAGKAFREAVIYTEKAKRALSAFGKRAHMLLKIADFAIERAG